ncbi:hypothetical protein FOL46_003470 [Perkinsus olseni]|uniref:Uncharacterized protein n=1 Tax=Perkinsus olseni TaxID=32597 RepID=A0A7J6M2U1_PEROL|nr:hypothetical protein FOL46_003470 [Perkinsus olseni]
MTSSSSLPPPPSTLDSPHQQPAVIKITKPPILPILGQTFVSSSSAGGGSPDGPRCQVSLPLKESFMKIIDDAGFAVPEGLPIEERRGKCVIPSQGKREDAEIICYSYDTCGDACTERGTNNRCPDPSTLEEEVPFNETPLECSVYMRDEDNDNAVVIIANCIDVKDGSYCNNVYTLTPANVVTMRGLICGVVFITLFWLVAEFILRYVDIGLRREKAEGMAKMAIELPAKRKYLRAQLERRWDEEAMLQEMEEGQEARAEGFYHISRGDAQACEPPLAPTPPPAEGGFTESGTSSSLTCSITLANTNYQTPMKSGKSSNQTPYPTAVPSPVSSTPFTLSAMWTPDPTIITTTQLPPPLGHPDVGPPLWSSRQSVLSGDVVVGMTSRGHHHHPRKRYDSNAWRRRIRQWKELKAQKLTTYRNKQLSRSILLNIFFILLITLTLFLIIYFSPQQLKTQRTVLEAVVGNVSIWNVSTWLDLLIFVDVLLDVMLFLIACMIVKWPSAPLFSRHIQGVLKTAAEAEAAKNVKPAEQQHGDAGVREDEIRDIPPCPPHPDIDWFTVWQGDDDDTHQSS